jgi:DNA-binding transcriptional LysR family regulator
MLENGKVDMAIRMMDGEPDGMFRSVKLWAERIFLLGDNNHPLARKRSVAPTDLAGQLLLLTESGCGYRHKLDQLLALKNIRPGNVTEFSSVEAIKQCVAAGMGVGLLPAIVVAKELRQRQFKMLPWAGPSLDITTRILWHRDKWVSPPMAAFQELLHEMLKEDEEVSPRLAG